MDDRGKTIPFRPADGEALAETELAPRGGAPAKEELATPAALVTEEATPEEEAVVVSDDVPAHKGADRFEAGGRIGSGGMGEVVLQIDRNIGRAVAKKMLHPEMHNDTSLRRFVREARVQGQLEHPAVVPVHDFGIDADGRLFFSMKRIRGKTLGQILERLAAGDRDVETRFSRRKLLSAFVQVCLAIEYAHKRGVIHRDLKPSNVMLGDFGEVYVLDWGLAKLTNRVADDADEAPVDTRRGRGSSPEMTSDGDFIGTPLYMAPEQLLGRHAQSDQRADVFGLGAILFEILTLEPLRRGATLADLVAMTEPSAPVERPSARVKDVPAELDDLCVSALAREPGERLRSARALADAVERYLEGDRDLALRRAQAAELVASARARLGAAPGTRASELVVALREVLKALALSPENEGAQRLLVSLVLEGSTELSPEAAEEFSERDADVRREGLRRGLIAFVGWLATLPCAIALGIRDWRLVGVLIALTVLCLGLGAVFLRAGARTERVVRAGVLLLSLLTGLTLALTSAWLGPFVLVPLAVCAAGTMFMVHLTPKEARSAFGVLLVAAVAPFLFEQLHLVAPAYTFEGGNLILHPRLLDLPEGGTLLFLAYTVVAFLGCVGYFIFQLRTKQRDAERRMFGQAWLLRRLFPSGTGEGA